MPVCTTSTPEGYAVCWAEKLCGAVFGQCACAEPDWATEADCMQWALAAWDDELDELGADGGTWNPGCAARYLTFLDEPYICAPYVEYLQLPSCPACTFFTGAVPAGGMCAADSDCVDGFECRGGICKNVCGGELGDACVTSWGCQGYFMACDGGVCAEAPSAPAPCIEDRCAPGNFCDDGVCHTATPNGEACTSNSYPNHECASLYCNDAGVCAVDEPYTCT